jgi:hypothetical protein
MGFPWRLDDFRSVNQQRLRYYLRLEGADTLGAAAKNPAERMKV